MGPLGGSPPSIRNYDSNSEDLNKNKLGKWGGSTVKNGTKVRDVDRSLDVSSFSHSKGRAASSSYVDNKPIDTRALTVKKMNNVSKSHKRSEPVSSHLSPDSGYSYLNGNGTGRMDENERRATKVSFNDVIDEDGDNILDGNNQIIMNTTVVEIPRSKLYTKEDFYPNPTHQQLVEAGMGIYSDLDDSASYKVKSAFRNIGRDIKISNYKIKMKMKNMKNKNSNVSGVNVKANGLKGILKNKENKSSNIQ